MQRELALRMPSWGVALALLLAALGLTAPAASAAPAKPAIANDARLAGDNTRTRFIADLSKKVDVSVFALDDPYRVIVDLPDVSFQMPPGLGKETRGLVTGYRYGLFAPGKSRIVLDLSGPFLIDKAFVLDARPDQPARLVVDLIPTDRATFLAKLREEKHAAASETPPPAAEPPKQVLGPPVVVLDPGHGGVDPGTMSADGTTEKDVVLAFAKTLEDATRSRWPL